MHTLYCKHEEILIESLSPCGGESSRASLREAATPNRPNSTTPFLQCSQESGETLTGLFVNYASHSDTACLAIALT